MRCGLTRATRENLRLCSRINNGSSWRCKKPQSTKTARNNSGHSRSRFAGQEVGVMAVNAYVLIETEVGKSKAVASRLFEMARNGHSGQLSEINTVTGPYDVIVKITHDDLDSVGKVVTGNIQTIGGVQRTTTCLATRL